MFLNCDRKRSVLPKQMTDKCFLVKRFRMWKALARRQHQTEIRRYVQSSFDREISLYWLTKPWRWNDMAHHFFAECSKYKYTIYMFFRYSSHFQSCFHVRFPSHLHLQVAKETRLKPVWLTASIALQDLDCSLSHLSFIIGLSNILHNNCILLCNLFVWPGGQTGMLVISSE